MEKGQIAIQAMARREELAGIVLDEGVVEKLLILAARPEMSDSMATVKALVTEHEELAARYLEKNHEVVFERMMDVVHCGAYLTQRLFLNFLGKMLLQKSNFKVMVKYVAESKHLQSAMTLLKSESAAICFEAFHIFKIFVANPKKSRNVHVILYQNKRKLIAFFGQFLAEKAANDDAFKHERESVVKYIADLAAPPAEKEKADRSTDDAVDTASAKVEVEVEVQSEVEAKVDG